MRVTDEKDEKDKRKMRVKDLRGKDMRGKDLRGKGCSSDLGGASESDGAYEDDVKGRFTIHIEFYTSLIIACSPV